MYRWTVARSTAQVSCRPDTLVTVWYRLDTAFSLAGGRRQLIADADVAIDLWRTGNRGLWRETVDPRKLRR